MTISIDNVLKHSYVITIDSIRYSRFCRLFAEARLDTPLPVKFTGFQLSNGAHREAGMIKTSNICNCTFSHLAVVKTAQAQDLDYVCIFEDDAAPCKDCNQKLALCLQHIPDDADLVKLGHWGSIDTPKQVNSFFESAMSFGSHAYIIFKKYYSRFVDNAYVDMHIDRLAMNNKGGGAVYQTSQLLFMQRNLPGECTLHDNTMYQKLLVQQGKI